MLKQLLHCRDWIQETLFTLARPAVSGGGQLVLGLGQGDDAELAVCTLVVALDQPQLRSRLINFRFVAFTAFMLDVHNQLGILSKSYQSNSLVIFDISKNLNRTLRQHLSQHLS